MSRYPRSLSRDYSSPYGSMSGGAPAVTDEDFSYITSQDLQDSPYVGSRSPVPPPEADVLIIKNKGITYPAHFPAYSIGDGKLQVKDVRDRVGLMMELPERAIRRIKLLYKGRQLKEPAAPVRDYGVKNNSELLAVLPDVRDETSPSDEEMVVVKDPSKSSKKKRSKRKSKSKGDGGEASSPRDSASNLNDRSPSPLPGAVAMRKLDELDSEYWDKLQPLCKAFIFSPPSDPKKREEDHRRLSETILQNIILKLDAVDTEGIPEVRAKRKELVTVVQNMLKNMDKVKASFEMEGSP